MRSFHTGGRSRATSGVLARVPPARQRPRLSPTAPCSHSTCTSRSPLQDTARSVTGADAGCTHLSVDQTDYAGEQGTAVSPLQPTISTRNLEPATQTRPYTNHTPTIDPTPIRTITP